MAVFLQLITMIFLSRRSVSSMVCNEHSWLSSMSATVVKHISYITNQKLLTDVLG